MIQQHFEILGTGSDLPGPGVGVAEIERRAALPAGWIATHTAVTTRYECVFPESLASMAKRAIERALQDANVDWTAIDLIIDCSTSQYQPIPCNAARVQALFGASAAGIPAFDIHGTCLGFLLGLNVANCLLSQQMYQTILLVASEATLKAINWEQPESATILGDGAAAMLLGRTPPRPGYGFLHQTYAEHYTDCQVRGGGHDLPAFDYSEVNQDCFRFHMEGPKLFQTALKRLPGLVDQLLKTTDVRRDRLRVVPHQASPKALELIRRRLQFSQQQFVNIAQNYGNMAAASIPFVIDQLRKESAVEGAGAESYLLLGTSAGYSQAGLIFQA